MHRKVSSAAKKEALLAFTLEVSNVSSIAACYVLGYGNNLLLVLDSMCGLFLEVYFYFVFAIKSCLLPLRLSCNCEG